MIIDILTAMGVMLLAIGGAFVLVAGMSWLEHLVSPPMYVAIILVTVFVLCFLLVVIW